MQLCEYIVPVGRALATTNQEQPPAPGLAHYIQLKR